ncbi:FAD-binding domain-containing protein [Pantoea agglomerans]|uniref:FAD-binding domain-containing protein n=1 Tax=Enterobacter agglomerans TaxID=549 RepID=UPI003C7B5391
MTFLRSIGGHLTVLEGTVTGALSELRRRTGRFVLHSHEETGNLWTFSRDKNVMAWCRARGCDWFQYAQNGVCRPVSRRHERFKAHWDAWSARPLFCVPEQADFLTVPDGLATASLPQSVCHDPWACPGRQTGGRAAGLAAWLAQLFVDYDPGIHYPQIQMQSGMAANGVLRIYNPVMQAHSLDPDARFVRTWVPELRDISDAWIFEPWKMPSRLQKQAEQQSGVSVSLPLVDFALEHRQAKAAVASLRQRHGLTAAPGFREKPDGQHTRRPATRKETGVKKKKDAQQLDLF